MRQWGREVENVRQDIALCWLHLQLRMLRATTQGKQGKTESEQKRKYRNFGDDEDAGYLAPLPLVFRECSLLIDAWQTQKNTTEAIRFNGTPRQMHPNTSPHQPPYTTISLFSPTNTIADFQDGADTLVPFHTRNRWSDLSDVQPERQLPP